MSALESLNPFFNPALVSEMRAGSATAPDLSESPVAVVVNSVSAISAESVATVTPGPTPVPVVAVASDSELRLSCEVRVAAAAESNLKSHSSPMHDGRTWEQRRALNNGDSLVLEPTLTGRGPCDSGATNSIPPIGLRSQVAGPTPAADALTGSAAFSFQPDFEKLFNTIFELTDMQAMLICADEELRVETLLGDRRQT